MTFFNTHLAKKPPMGWNSWDCYSVSINEEEFKSNAEFIAKHLKHLGWEYVVLDLGWYAVDATHETYKNEDIDVVLDDFGRFLPCPKKFPSSQNGQGLKPLADFVHSLGLKFGLHIMRGIPLRAVKRELPVKGTLLYANDVSYADEKCPWFNSMRTLDFSKDGAQAYYDSIFELYAQWGVDYIKADDLNSWHEVKNSDGSPTGLGSPYRIDDIEAISSSIKSSKRDMLLSLSPGGPETTIINHLRKHSNLWRISADFWDEWGSLKKQMERCARWAPFAVEGHWPDADMLPIGFMPRGESGGLNRKSNFTENELHTLMTLWCMARSPLMLGADLPNTDTDTIALISNADVIDINQHSRNNRRIASKDGLDIWLAESTASNKLFVAFFNKNDDKHEVTFDVTQLETGDIQIDKNSVTELWKRYESALKGNSLTLTLAPHDAAVYSFECV